MFSSCGTYKNKNVTLWRNDKIAYGTYYAYHNLHYFFNDAEISTNNSSPIYFDKTDSNEAYIIIGTNMRPDARELTAMIDYAELGNHIFISAVDIGKNLLDSLHLIKTNYRNTGEDDSLTVNVRHNTEDELSTFVYPGFSLDNVFTKIDTSVTSVLGTDEQGHANFIKLEYNSGGSISIHLAPLAFSNFFLLHKNNKRYYDLAMSSIPPGVHTIRWDDYYRSHVDGSDNSQTSIFSKLSAFVKHPVLRWAFWLAIILFIIIYLFESKRKQRPIPVVKEPRNSSLDFVQTIGRLYYQRRDNKNLADKMAAHFLGYIRTKYNLSTALADESFEQALSFKTGYPLAKVQEIISFVRSTETNSTVSDAALLSFSKMTDQFYKQT